MTVIVAPIMTACLKTPDLRVFLGSRFLAFVAFGLAVFAGVPGSSVKRA
jgi:hypothetical protein